MNVSNSMKVVKIGLAGLGSVGKSLMQIFIDKEKLLEEKYNIQFQIVYLSDSSGTAIDSHFDIKQILELKKSRKHLSDLDFKNDPNYKFANKFAVEQQLELLKESSPLILFEATPVNPKTGNPGLDLCKTALTNGIHVVLANKGPLILAFQELHKLAAAHKTHILFSATVCGGMPIINIGRRDLLATKITLFRGVFNSTTNYILGEMIKGRSYHDSLAEAQERGIAETNPSLDVEGWDTAFKLVICSNAILGYSCGISDIKVEGITKLTLQDIQKAKDQGMVYKLIAKAEQISNENPQKSLYQLSVAPTLLLQEDFLAQVNGWEMGVELKSDLYETISLKMWEREPISTSGSMLRDSIHILEKCLSN